MYYASWDFCGRPNLSFLTHFHWQVAKYANKERGIAKIFAFINILYEAIGLNRTNNVSFEVLFDKEEYGSFFFLILLSSFTCAYILSRLV